MRNNIFYLDNQKSNFSEQELEGFIDCKYQDGIAILEIASVVVLLEKDVATPIEQKVVNA